MSMPKEGSPVSERDVATGLASRKENTLALSRALGDPVRLFYPAGGYDLYHLAMPSVRVMAIMDPIPLLLDQPTARNT